MPAINVKQSFSKRVDMLSKDMLKETLEFIDVYLNDSPCEIIKMKANFDIPKKLTEADIPEELRSEGSEMLSFKYHSFEKNIYTN